MLILIYGVTGMVGQATARAALHAGHKVRGISRNPDKLDKDILNRLDSFIKMEDIYDMTALNEAVKGVDAVISAATYTPHALVDGQILLLRASERAGVKVSRYTILPCYRFLRTCFIRSFTQRRGITTGRSSIQAIANLTMVTSVSTTTLA
jgi:uncharacterized protein YbjT (DUF2867 family)